ncbi:protein kinase domain-containing protein [Sorangium sp. So ce394]|uniref:serine/threonine-protein kinase n=1 Tax=Sorangium sp. So ce394 TaxID=3133310 RepID=UPI003F5C152C
MSATLADGTVFAHRYRVVRLLAVGAMGSVYEAVHLETNRRRALKVMHAYLFQSEEMRSRFKREAQITADIESEYIVDVFDAGIDDATGMPFLVMELLRGEELGQRLKRLGRLPPGEVATYLQQTASALDRTHAAAIIHRDLKPENLFVTHRDDGTPRMKILDFGVAKLLAEGGTAAGLTRSLGTPIYMAPEQFRVDTKLTSAVDIYALGLIAYTLLVGTPYWSPEALSAGDVIAFALVVVHGPKEPPVQRAMAHRVVLPPGFDAWFAKVAAVDPAARFRTASEAAQALSEVLGLAAASSGPVPHPSAPSWSLASAPTPALGTPSPGTTAPGMPALATPAPGMTAPGTTAPGMPAPGMPAPGMTAPVLMTPAMTSVAPLGPEHPARAPGVPLAATMMETSMTSVPAGPIAPAKPGRAPFVAAAAVLGLGVLVVAGSWLLMRTGAEPDVAASPEAAAQDAGASGAAVTPAPSAAPTAGPSASTEPSAVAADPSASAGPSAAAADPSAAQPDAAASAPSASAGPAARRPASAPPKAPPRPAPSERKGTSTRPKVPLLGRD